MRIIGRIVGVQNTEQSVGIIVGAFDPNITFIEKMDWSENMLKIGICDDSKIFLICAEKLIRKWSDERRIPVKIYTFNNGDKLVAANTEERLDIIFLDIIMPLLNGMDAARELRQRDKSVKIIFLTSSPEFALESYEVKAQGYVLKPIAYDKLKELLDECAHSFAEEPKNMVIKTVTGYQKLYFHEIEYAEAQNKRVFFHLRSGNIIESTEPFHSFEDRFSSQVGFFKCHRSYLVYLQNVDHFTTAEITMKSGRNIPISRGYAKAFKEAYFAQMFQDS